MGRFRLRSRGVATTAERRIGEDAAEPELLAEIARLSAVNRTQPDARRERDLVRLRHQAGRRRRERADGGGFAAADATALPAVPAGSLPELCRDELSPGLLRAGILRDGCVLVRGLVERDVALELARLIDDAFAARAAQAAGRRATPGLYDELDTVANLAAMRPWIEQGGGVLAADAPRATFALFELLGAAGLPQLVEGYLGEPALLSVEKTTLRKATPDVGGAWHQDGAFMGDVRALNLWLSLSRCGDVAPGLELVPRRVDQVVIEHEAMLDVELTRERARAAAGDVGIVRPIFEPGDALFFDELFLHQTASDPAMPHPRFAVESWFFGGSGFPEAYAPLAV